MPRPVPSSEVDSVRRYFGSFADDYHQAFEGKGSKGLHGFINRLFRRKTFQKRTEIVQRLLEGHGLSGKTVLDVGCGSGEVSIIAARMGGHVTGIDISEEMVEIARANAARSGVSDSAAFRTGDITSGPLPPADITLLVAVIEYYRKPDPIVERIAKATRELLIIVDTRGPLWRRTLRHLLAKLKRIHIYYHSPDQIARTVERAGFVERNRIAGHSFTVLSFRRAAGDR